MGLLMTIGTIAVFAGTMVVSYFMIKQAVLAALRAHDTEQRGW